jgi:hypothetical protein
MQVHFLYSGSEEFMKPNEINAETAAIEVRAHCMEYQEHLV